MTQLPPGQYARAMSARPTWRIGLAWLTGLALAAALLVAAGYFASFALHRPEPAARVAAPTREPGVLTFPAGAPQLSALRIATTEDAPLPLAEPLNARIAYNENATSRVGSPIAGRVISLHAQPGDTVKAGDALLELDSPELAAAVADLRKASADETRKALALDRAARLHEGGVVSRKDLESAEADAAQARAETQRARLRLRNLSPSAGEAGGFSLRAPIGGVVADRKVNPGAEVRPDLPDPLFTITDPSRLWVLIDLPERALAKVTPKQSVVIEVDAYPDERFSATIERIGQVIDPATRRVQVRAAIGNADGRLKPEMYARATLLGAEGTRAVRIPNTALVTERLNSYVFVERAPGVFERRTVTLAFQDPNASYVATGLKADERVVVAGAVLLNSELQETR